MMNDLDFTEVEKALMDSEFTKHCADVLEIKPVERYEPLADIGCLGHKQIRNGVTRSYNPWNHIHLEKSERKGKTYEEIQAIKKQRFERSNP
jgi:hypothetical protein